MSAEPDRRTAFVTGAAYGIGAASALALARDGCDVAVSELKLDDLAETIEAITAVSARAVPVTLDLRSVASIDRAMAEVLAAFGQLDVLINNAGVPLTRPAVDVTEAEWDEVIDVNLKGTFFLSQQMGRHLIASDRPGCIVSIASTHGVIGLAARSTYGISKAGVSHMTRMLAISDFLLIARAADRARRRARVSSRRRGSPWPSGGRPRSTSPATRS